MSKFELTIEVTWDDLARGQRRNAEFCPIAMGLRRSIKYDTYSPTRVYVSPIAIFLLNYEGALHRAEHTPESRKFLELYDSSLYINAKPTAFTFQFEDLSR